MLKILFSLLLLMLSGNALAKECVILLHGLLRGSGSMVTIERALVRAGYEVSNIVYPSRGYKIEQLAEMAIDAGIQSCQQKSATPINFVTHSLGGILV
ncbi:MAG TPA: alpha/beta hydrolase, partial [Chromatiales bacterium]|nr:alpha/beta hydrolase [Chromatiales bacterium]